MYGTNRHNYPLMDKYPQPTDLFAEATYGEEEDYAEQSCLSLWRGVRDIS